MTLWANALRAQQPAIDAEPADTTREASTAHPPAPAEPKAATGPARETSADGLPQPDAVPKDPRGVQGISPFAAALRAGDVAMMARDYELAAAKYAEAIKSAPEDPRGHLRDAQLDLHRGDYAAAREAVDAALRVSRNEPVWHARARLLLAMVNERQSQLQQARKAWSQVRAHAPDAPAVAPPEVQGEPSGGNDAGNDAAGNDAAGRAKAPKSLTFVTARERIKVIDARTQQLQAYEQVAQRIQARLAEAEKASPGAKTQ